MVEKLLHLCTNYGGHADERRLVGFIEAIRVTPYSRENIEMRENMVLVDTQQYLTERTSRQLPTSDVIPMRLHPTVQHKIMELYKTYSGHNHEMKLRRSFADLDFTPYESKTSGDFCVVLMSDYMKALRGSPTS